MNLANTYKLIDTLLIEPAEGKPIYLLVLLSPENADPQTQQYHLLLNFQDKDALVSKLVEALGPLVNHDWDYVRSLDPLSP